MSEGESESGGNGGGGDGGSGRPSPSQKAGASSNRLSAAPATNSFDGAAGDASGEATAGPALRYTLLFLLIATLLQVRSTSRNEAGPFDAVAERILPQLLSWGIDSVGDGPEDGGTDAMKCPPDMWVDEAFVPQHYPTDIYSEKLDPRNKVSRPSLFPHCALQRWVQSESDAACPEGEEYVTVIQPPSVAKQSKVEGKIPRIIHLSSRTNCLPTSTVRTLRALTQQDASRAFSIYVHSNRTIDNILYQKEWWEFPQVKEGAMCGSKKIEAVAHAALGGLKPEAAAAERQRMAEEIGMDVKRDLWRLMVLWEYGGVVLDAGALHDILSVRGAAASSTAANNSTGVGTEGHKMLKTLMRQWSSEEEADMLLYFVGNNAKERVPQTDIVAAAPHHALVYYAAKIALKYATWDMEKAIDDFGPTTKISAIRDGLKSLDRGWQNTKTGGILQLKNEKKETIRFVDGDAVLPPALASPRTAPWRSIFDAFNCKGNSGVEEKVSAMLRNFAGEQVYVGPRTLFSCNEYMLDAYLQTTTTAKKT
ncbi:hypothetical protein ACHAXT_003943 [Thalassiosira profunda]